MNLWSVVSNLFKTLVSLFIKSSLHFAPAKELSPKCKYLLARQREFHATQWKKLCSFGTKIYKTISFTIIHVFHALSFPCVRSAQENLTIIIKSKSKFRIPNSGHLNIFIDCRWKAPEYEMHSSNVDLFTHRADKEMSKIK